MSKPMTQAAYNARTRQIQAQQESISEAIRGYLNQLQQIADGSMLNIWMTVAPGEPHTHRISRKEDLMKKVRRLRSELKALNRENRDLRLKLLRANAERAGDKNRAAMKAILINAEDRGFLTPDEEARLIREAGNTLRIFIGVLQADPSPESIKGVLEGMADYYVFGFEGVVADDAWNAMGEASLVIKEKAERDFKLKPNEDNFRNLLNAAGQMQELGVELSDNAGLERPADFKPAEPGTVHEVKQGDTLAKISEMYYETPSHWHVIYYENAKAIGDDIGKLKIGTKLKIP